MLWTSQRPDGMINMHGSSSALSLWAHFPVQASLLLVDIVSYSSFNPNVDTSPLCSSWVTQVQLSKVAVNHLISRKITQTCWFTFKFNILFNLDTRRIFWQVWLPKSQNFLLKNTKVIFRSHLKRLCFYGCFLHWEPQIINLLTTCPGQSHLCLISGSCGHKAVMPSQGSYTQWAI